MEGQLVIVLANLKPRSGVKRVENERCVRRQVKVGDGDYTTQLCGDYSKPL